MSDELDRLSDDALLSYLTRVAGENAMRVVIEERNGGWFAESLRWSGLGGEMVVLAGTDPTVAQRCCASRSCSPMAADLKAGKAHAAICGLSHG